jgi:hypothetical protein
MRCDSHRASDGRSERQAPNTGATPSFSTCSGRLG